MIDKEAEYFYNDIFAIQQAGIVILEATNGYAKCKMDINKNHLNADGFVMGGAIFTLADFTASIASNIGHPTTVTLNGNIDFISAGTGPALFAETKMIKDGKSIALCEVDITNDSDIELQTLWGRHMAPVIFYPGTALRVTLPKNTEVEFLNCYTGTKTLKISLW